MIIASLGLGITGVFLGISICAAFFELGAIISIPGSFFVRSYGILAFLIPVYLLYAAFLLADPHYRPEHIFILCALVFPFFTLALGFYWIREFETLRAESSFIARAGKLGIGFFIFFLTSLEVLVIILLRFLLFKAGKKTTNEKTAPDEMKLPEDAFTGTPSPVKNKSQSLRDIYAETAAAMSADGDLFTSA